MITSKAGVSLRMATSSCWPVRNGRGVLSDNWAIHGLNRGAFYWALEGDGQAPMHWAQTQGLVDRWIQQPRQQQAD